MRHNQSQAKFFCKHSNFSLDCIQHDIIHHILRYSLNNNIRLVNKAFKSITTAFFEAARIIQRKWIKECHKFICITICDDLDGIIDMYEILHAYESVGNEEWLRDFSHYEKIYMVATVLSNLNEQREPFDAQYLPTFFKNTEEINFFFSTVFRDNIKNKLCICSNENMYWEGLICPTCFSVSNGNNNHVYGSCYTDHRFNIRNSKSS